MEPTGPKRTKYYKDNPEAVAERNSARLTAMRIAGTKRQADWLALPTTERSKFLEHARFLMDIGSDFVVSAVAEDTVHSGFVYAIYHPRMHGVKIGRAFDPESRLSNYNTGCPMREYVLHHAVYFEDCRTAEERIHARLSELRLTGEWFDIEPEQAAECIDWFKRKKEC